MLMLSIVNAMILITDFEKAGGGGEEDQKWFLELPWARARQLKIMCFLCHNLKANKTIIFDY